MLGLKLKELREKEGLTQSELARRLNVSPSTIGMYEQDRRRPDITMLQIISNFFNVSIDCLVGNEKKAEEKRKMNNKVEILQRAAENGMSDEELDDILSYAQYKYKDRFTKNENK